MSYKVMKNTAKGLKPAGKKHTAFTFAKAKEMALETSESCPGVGVVVIDSAGRPCFDTVVSTQPRYTSSAIPRAGSESVGKVAQSPAKGRQPRRKTRSKKR